MEDPMMYSDLAGPRFFEFIRAQQLDADTKDLQIQYKN